VLTWAADEHVLGVIAGGLWLAARAGNDRERRQTDHLALSIVVTAILPHLLKRLIDQKRPDRCMVHGPRRGIPRSGKPYDAFPSGHVRLDGKASGQTLPGNWSHLALRKPATSRAIAGRYGGHRFSSAMHGRRINYSDATPAHATNL
jgi:hypothetical protein